MIDLLSLFDFDEGSSGATDVLQVEYAILECDFCVIARNALVQD